LSKERESKPEQGPENRCSGQGARGESECVDEVQHDGQVCSHQAKPKDPSTDDRHDPVYPGLCRPTVPEEANGHEEGPDNQRGNPHLWFAFTAIFVTQVEINLVGNMGSEKSGKEETQTQTDVSQTANARVEVVLSAEEVWECRKHEVVYSVHQSHIQTQDETHEATRQENGRPGQVSPEILPFAAFMIGREVRMSGSSPLKVFANLIVSLKADDRSISLPERYGKNCSYATKRDYNIEYILHSDGHGYEPSHDRTHSGTYERSQTVNSHCRSAVLFGK